MTYLDGGPWTSEDHARHPSFDAGLMAAIIDHLAPADRWQGAGVIDLGCGPGRYLEPLASLGAICLGVEPHFMSPDVDWAQLCADIAGPLPMALADPPPHLTICLEVLEHIDRAGHRRAFDNIAQIAAGGILVFSAATPGQGGQGHITERPEAEWRDELAARGLTCDERATADLRAAADLPWHRSNVMVWRRK